MDKLYEYKYLDVSPHWLEERLNEHAKEGWRVISTQKPKKDKYYWQILLERCCSQKEQDGIKSIDLVVYNQMSGGSV